MILIHIRKKARQRAAEWFCALNLVLFGLTLLAPGATFDLKAYAAFRAVFGEAATGGLTLLVGLVWSVGLVVNGVRQQLTSTVRATCCFAGVIVYALITLAYVFGSVRAGILVPNAGGNAAIMVLALFCLYWIGEEKGGRTDG
ncbi:hypothetical protein [Jiella pacifica]|uniref:Uncharacterized protein n=1 Tax=Jiella pacifica TaxID=2696469 RepID=A0A6N9T6E7_9HYPH|nr:hypothetical protein [Jiella pacifica]NDW06964.1 hypothetical protein [Jiella pacifica]